MTQTLSRDRKPAVRPRKAPGAVLPSPEIVRVTQTFAPQKRPPVTVKPIRTPLYRSEDFWLGVSAIVATVALVWRFG